MEKQCKVTYYFAICKILVPILILIVYGYIYRAIQISHYLIFDPWNNFKPTGGDRIIEVMLCQNSLTYTSILTQHHIKSVASQDWRISLSHFRYPNNAIMVYTPYRMA